MTINMKEYPNICAWCGNTGNMKYIVGHAKDNKPVLILILINIIRIIEYSIVLPICDECIGKSRERKIGMFIFSIMGAIIFMIAAGMLFLKANIGTLCIMLVFLSGIVGAIIGAALSQLIIRMPLWGEVKNGRIRFYNDQFQESIKILNSSILESDISKYADRNYLMFHFTIPFL